MPEGFHLSAVEIVALHDRATALWHQDPDAQPALDRASQSLSTILAQHRANFDLWHTEDRARTPNATDRDIALVKRAIDEINQRRNDLTEQCDVVLYESLKKANLPDLSATLHSESPGLMIDRLSILALKVFHTREEIDRPNAPAATRNVIGTAWPSSLNSATTSQPASTNSGSTSSRAGAALKFIASSRCTTTPP